MTKAADEERGERSIEYVSLRKLRADPRNPKAHAGEAIEHSVGRFGFVEPIVVDERTGYIASGHGRVETLTRMRVDQKAAPKGVRVTSKGDWLVPVVKGWESSSDAEAGAALIAFNRTTELGGWVDEALLDLLQEIEDADALGFSGEEIADLEAQVAADAAGKAKRADVDDVPELRRVARSRPGDVWLLGEHRVICGDATDPEVYAALLGSERPDVMWTDPPYGVEYVGKTKDALRIQNDGAGGLAALLTDAFAAAVPALRSGAPVYIAHADSERVTFEAAARSAGIDVRQNLVWVKNTLVLGRSDYHYRHEPILYGFTKAAAKQGRLGRGGARWYGSNAETTTIAEAVPARKRRDTATLAEVAQAILDGTFDALEVDPVELVEALLGGGSGSTVFEVAKPAASREHPTMKPTGLIKAHLGNSARAKDLVLDPFGGSGSTLIAADVLGMRARLIELDPIYVDAIVDRWEAVTGKKARRA
jgi:site-specific DNA-methyltransferase (adenine-specific)